MNKEEESSIQGAMLMQELNRTYGLELAESPSAEQMELLLADKLNTMIRTDFSALVQLLYRIDINETRLRQLLTPSSPAEGETEDAGKIIARLIIERQRQKIQTRRQYSSPPPADPNP
ncbi:MAG TPA: hypothetical protein VNS58_01665 [Puia sp.]|jgi:hypothetical protein|nr:hypothetical protein [Puia sp.]